MSEPATPGEATRLSDTAQGERAAATAPAGAAPDGGPAASHPVASHPVASHPAAVHTARCNTLAGRLMVEELARLGVRHVVVAPGSRSTPLVDAAARHPGVTLHVVVDERVAAFFALGLGRGADVPAALVTTSGSAMGHALPAVIEADASNVPLLLISADRPPELRDTGANQTVDQVHLFGRRVRHFADLPCPDPDLRVRALLTTVDHAVAAARTGPVHLNCAFRKPLDPAGPPGLAALLATVLSSEGIDATLRAWLESKHPFTRWYAARRAPTGAALDATWAALSGASRGFVIVGGIDSAAEREAARTLVARLGWPTHADLASGLRLGPSTPSVLPHHDLMLASPAWADALAPDVVVRIGGPLVSAAVERWLAARPPTHHVVLRAGPRRQDPDHTVTLRVDTDLAAFVAASDARYPTGWPRSRSAARTPAWHAVAAEVGAGLGALQGDEIAAARGVCAALPAGAGLWAASSMAVRLLDAFAPSGGAPVDVAAARGASGIDGLIAQAAGWSVQRGSPVVLLVGDLAALHDMGSLALLRDVQPHVVVVVVNNGGGGIFSLLPIREASAAFEPAFAAAHDQGVVPVAAALGVPARGVGGPAALPGAIAAALAEGAPRLVELVTDRDAAHTAWTAAREAVASWTTRHLQTQHPLAQPPGTTT